MRNFVKFLENGEYHYATVKDVGDIDQLVTSNKTDVVAAINEIITKLVGGSNEYNNLDKTIQDKLREVAEEAAGKIDQAKQEATDKIGEAKQISADGIAALQKLTQQEIDDAVSKANKSIDEANKSIADANQTITDTQNDLRGIRDKFNADNDTLNKTLSNLKTETENTIKEANNKIKTHDDNIKVINDKADGLAGNLAQTKEDLSTVTKDLEDTQIGVTTVNKKVDDVKGELEYKVSQEALDNVQGQVEKNTNDIKMNKDGLEVKADKSSVDTLTQDVDKVNGTLQIHSDKISQMVTRESLINDLDNLDIKADNLLTGSREFSDWDISNNATIHVTNEKFRECNWASIIGAGEFISVNVSELTIGATYTLSIGAKTTKNGGTVQVVAKHIGALQDITKNTNVTTTPTQYTISFVVNSENITIGLGMTGSLSDGNELYISQPKLEKGVNATGWALNINDNYNRVEKVEAKQIVQDGQITDVVQKQRDFGDKQTKDETSISLLSNKLQVASENLTQIGQKVTDTNTKIDVTAGTLKANLSEEVNQKIGAISDSSNNQILNSSFANQLDKWQGVSAKAKITKIQDNNWVEFQQSGSTYDTPIAIQSNYYPVKNQDTITVAFDFLKKSDIGLDNMTILLLEIFDKKDSRVDFKELSVSSFGENITQDTPIRLSYKYVITHADAQKMTIKPILYRNGHILFSKIFAKVSTISNGEYTPNPDDMKAVVATQQLAIDANTRGLTAKADKTSVDSLTQTVTNHSSSISLLNDQMQQKTTRTDFDKLTGRVNTAEQKIVANADGITNAVSKVDGVRNDLDNMQVGGTNLLTNTSDFSNPDIWVSKAQWYSLDEKYKGLSIMRSNAGSDWAGLSQYYQVKAGETYTFSLYARNADGEGASWIYIPLNTNPENGKKSADLQLLNGTHPTLDTAFKRVSSTFLIKSDGWIKPRMEKGKDNPSQIDVCGYKLEKGNVATDYSVAPQDQATVTALNIVKQTADKTYEGLFNSDGSNKIEKTAQGMTAQITTAKNDMKTYADGAVNGLEIGGNNLLTGTNDWSNWHYNKPQTDFQTIDGIQYIHSKISGSRYSDVYQIIRLNDVGSYTFSFTYKGNVQVFVLMQDIGNSKNGTDIDFSKPYNENQETISSSTFTRFKKTVSISKSSMCDIILRVHTSDVLEFWAEKAQLERGTKATDWGLSAAELATQSDVSKALTQSKDYATTTINAKAGELTAQLTSTTTTLKTYADSSATNAKNAAISTAASDATTKANSAKSQAVSTAASDATTKANSAKSQAVSTASSDATTKANNAQNNAISQSKTYADTTITAKAGELTAKITSVQKNVDNLETGGVNLLENTNQGTKNWFFQQGNGVYNRSAFTIGKYQGIQVNITTASTNWFVWQYPIDIGKLMPNSYYTISFMARFSTKITIPSIGIQKGNSSGNIMVSSTNATIPANTDYLVSIKMKTTGTIPSDSGQDVYFHGFTGVTGTFKVWNLKLEQGTVASAWCEADQDAKSYAETILSAKAGELTAKLSSNTTDLKTYADNSATTKANGALSNAKTYADNSATNAKNSAISTASSDATTKANNAKSQAVSTAASDATTKANSAKSQAVSTASSDATTKANNAQNNAKSYAETILNAKAGQLTAATNAADYRNLFSMNSSGILLDAHGVNNSNKSIILSSDHVVIDSSKPVSIPAAAVKGTLTAASFYQYSGGTNTWLDQNGFHQQSNGQDTWISNGVISTNVINAKNYLHVGNYDNDPRKEWGADVTKSGLSFTVPVKISGHTSNNISDYQSEIQGYMGGYGWDYTKATAKGSGASGMVIGLATQQDWGDPFGGDYIQIGRYVPTENGKDPQQGRMEGGMIYSPLGVGSSSKGFVFQEHVLTQSGLFVEGGDVHFKSSSSEDITFTSGTGTTNLTSGAYVYSGGGRSILGNRWGDQWIVLQNKQMTNMDTNKLASLRGWEFQYGKLTNTSRLSRKKDIELVDKHSLAIKLYGIDLASYRYKNEQSTVKKSLGPVVDDVNKDKKFRLASQFISDSGEGTDDHALITALIATVQEQKQQISRLEMRMINQEI